jgi:hypothetical protein
MDTRKPVRQEIFPGIVIGMQEAEFYEHCREMNAAGIYTNTSNNSAVVYRNDSYFGSPVTWKFFPEFQNGLVTGVRATVGYDAYAPWNNRYFADSLIRSVSEMIVSKYNARRVESKPVLPVRAEYISTEELLKITTGLVGEAEVFVEFHALEE